MARRVRLRGVRPQAPACGGVQRERREQKARRPRPTDLVQGVHSRCGGAERALAAATAKLRVKEGGDGADASAATHECAACERSRPADAFSNKQLNQKGPGKQRCRECCDAAEAAEASSAKTHAEARLTRAREASAIAEKTNAPDKLAVFAREAALEAELVTGLKPKRIGGRGRGGGGAFGRGGTNRNSALGRGGR